MLPATAAHAFVDDLDAPTLTAADEHHLFRVLRLRPDERITVSDGNGRWRACRVATGGLAPDGDVTVVPRPSPQLTIAFALTKGERPEWVVQKLTELGVDEIVPMTTRHTVVRWDAARAAKAQARWSEVARAAAMQARLVRVPVVAPVVLFAELVAERDPDLVALAHPGGDAPALGRPIVLIGPEGGWAADELEAARATVHLGPTNLRADTAAVAVGVRLCALRANHLDFGAE